MSQRIHLDATPGLFHQVLHCHQGDVGRQFEIAVVTRDGYEIPSGATFKIQATKPSGLGFTVTGTAANNIISFTSTEDMTSEAGEIPTQLEIKSGNDVIYTSNFLLVCEKNTHPASITDGSPEESISEITLLVERAESAASTAGADAAAAAQARVDEMMDYLPSEVADLKSDLTNETNARILLAGRVTTAEGDIDTLETHKVAQPLDDNNQPTNGTSGQLLRTKGDGFTEWVDEGLPTDEQTAQAISDWLDAHPEATTTVADNSITNKKINKGSLGYNVPEMFGAVGDGVTDDTAALQECVDNSHGVLLMGTYMISSTITLHGDLTIIGNGKGAIIKDPATVTHFAALSYYDVSDIENVVIDGIRITGLQHWTGTSISGNANDLGIRLNNAKNIIIDNCLISECGASSIDVTGEYVRITNNIVEYSGSFTGVLPNYNFGISYEGNDFIIDNNIVRGVIQGILSGITNKNVVISNNDISTNGQHGLYIEGAERVSVVGNNIHDCSICGIKFQKGTDDTQLDEFSIVGNVICDCGGQGVLIADLSPNKTKIFNVVVSDNLIKNCTRGVDASYIENIAVSSNLIIGKSDYSLSYGVIFSQSVLVNIINNIIKTTASGSSAGAIFCFETAATPASDDINIKGNHLLDTDGIKFPFNQTITNISINGNVAINSRGSYDLYLDYAVVAQNTIVCNNIFPKGLTFRGDATTLKRCFNNVGVSYKEGITFINDNPTRVTVSSQNCYVKGDSVFINLSLKLLARGALIKCLSADIEGLSLAVAPANYSFDPIPGSDLTIMFSYSGTKLDVYIGFGTANTDYNIYLVL